MILKLFPPDLDPVILAMVFWQARQAGQPGQARAAMAARAARAGRAARARQSCISQPNTLYKFATAPCRGDLLPSPPPDREVVVIYIKQKRPGPV